MARKQSEKQLANLKPFTKGNVKQARECGKKGGIASGEARHRKRTMKELLLLQLQNKATEQVKQAVIKNGLNVSDDDIDFATAINSVYIGRALKGDVRAIEGIMAIQNTTPTDDMIAEKKQEERALLDALNNTAEDVWNETK